MDRSESADAVLEEGGDWIMPAGSVLGHQLGMREERRRIVDQFTHENETAGARESRDALRAAYRLPVEWTKSFLSIVETASNGNYGEALALLQASTLPEEVCSILRRAIATEDDHLIEQVLRDYEGRIGQAFCEACWR